MRSGGGRYFNISLNSEHHINPFDLPTPREDESPADVLRANVISLVGLFRLMLGGLTPEEDAIVDRAIAETYALKDITPDSDFSAIEPPLLLDFEMVLSGMDGAESLLTKLTKYTRGSWSGFINQPSNVDINRKFIVFSVRDMEDDLKPVAMYCYALIWNAIRRTLRKRPVDSVVDDEIRGYCSLFTLLQNADVNTPYRNHHTRRKRLFEITVWFAHYDQLSIQSSSSSRQHQSTPCRKHST